MFGYVILTAGQPNYAKHRKCNVAFSNSSRTMFYNASIIISLLHDATPVNEINNNNTNI